MSDASTTIMKPLALAQPAGCPACATPRPTWIRCPSCGRPLRADLWPCRAGDGSRWIADAATVVDVLHYPLTAAEVRGSVVYAGGQLFVFDVRNRLLRFDTNVFPMTATELLVDLQPPCELAVLYPWLIVLETGRLRSTRIGHELNWRSVSLDCGAPASGAAVDTQGRRLVWFARRPDQFVTLQAWSPQAAFRRVDLDHDIAEVSLPALDARTGEVWFAAKGRGGHFSAVKMLPDGLLVTHSERGYALSAPRVLPRGEVLFLRSVETVTDALRCSSSGGWSTDRVVPQAIVPPGPHEFADLPPQRIPRGDHHITVRPTVALRRDVLDDGTAHLTAVVPMDWRY